MGREVCFEELWSGRAQPAELWVPADAGMDRRNFLAASGATLTAPAWACVDHLGTRGGSFVALVDCGRTMTVTSTMVEVISVANAGLRALGNAEGGYEDNLRLVHHQLTSVATLLRQARFPHAAVANRLLAQWGQLSQVAGWLAHDAGDYGRSQRYFTSGLHAAHTADDQSGGVYLHDQLRATHAA